MLYYLFMGFFMKRKVGVMYRFVFFEFFYKELNF